MSRRFPPPAKPRPLDVLSPETLPVERLLARAGSAVALRGRNYFRQTWRFRLRSLTPREAVVRVQGSQRYEVEFMLDSDGVETYCDCPYADMDPGVVCKHAVAAALFLREHLRQHRPQEAWQEVLTKVTRNTAATGSGRSADEAATAVLLFFSLQKRGQSWAVVPYVVNAGFFPAEARADAEAVARVVAERQLSSQAVKLEYYELQGGRLRRGFANVTRAQTALLKMLSSSGLYYGNYYGGGIDLDAALSLLEGAPLYTGTDKNPLKQLLRVWPGVARVELEMKTGTEGVTLRPFAVLGDQTWPLGERETKLVSFNPLWALSGAGLFQLDATHETFALFQETPEIVVPADDEGQFLEKHLVPLAERFPLRGEEVRWENLRGAEPSPRLYLTEENKELRAALRFGYGDYEVSYDKGSPVESIRRDTGTGALVRVEREPVREQEWRERIGAEFGLKRGAAPDVFLLRSKVHPIDFLLRHVPKLASAGFEVFGEEELKSARVNRNRPTISFNVTSGIDWFDVRAVVQFGDTEVLLAEVRRAVRRRERFVKLADGTVGEIPPEWLERYRHLFGLGAETGEHGGEGGEGGDALRFNAHHVTLLDQLLTDEGGAAARVDAEFKRRRERLRDFTGIKQQKPPKQFNGELRPYQQAGLDWLYFLREYNFGGCLADDMGTGKTVVTLAFLQSLKERGQLKRAALLVVPRSLVFNWEREAQRFAPRLRVLNHAGAERAGDVSEFDDCDLALTTYGVLLRDVEMLAHYEFEYLILDEAQAIKNPLAETAKAARSLRGRHRLTLTGTPVENNTLELWSQFAFLNPGLLGSADYFREEFAGPIERKGDEGAAQLLRKLVHPFILRRTKDQVAKELPPRTERLMLCEMEAAQRRLYEEKRDYYRALLLKLIEDEGIAKARFRVLEGLLRLRQICNHPRLVEPRTKAGSAKFELLFETLETLHAEGHKALVFSQFVQMLKLVQTELKRRKLPFEYLDGKTKDRQGRVDQFQSDPSIPFFLISLRAGGVGLNLTAADYVIHIDPWWNPAVEMQATDRTHRIGQAKPVFVYKLIARDSVEEKIVELQERKRALATQLITTEGGFFKSLTAADIGALFS